MISLRRKGGEFPGVDMKLQLHNHSLMTIRTKKRIVWSVSIALGLVLLLAGVGPLIRYKKVDDWVCPVSGSTKRQVTWFGYFSHDESTTSALEQWHERREPSFEPQWRHTSTTTYYVLGRGYACGETPEIYQLRPILDGVVGKFSDERIAGLITVLRRGSHDEQRQAIQRISDDYFDTK
jgi:hypothetical protein